MTHIGILHEPNHQEPWIIAMECQPTRAKVLDHASCWSIEPMFSDFKSRGFGLEDTPLEDPKRLNSLLLIMSLAMYWCVSAGFQEFITNPTYTEKNPVKPVTQTIGPYAKLIALCFLGFNEGYVSC